MQIRVNGIVSESIVDGVGIRMAIFTQGCPHGCPACHNPQTHDTEGGYYISTEEIGTYMQENPLLDGITLTGGEPLLQPKPCAELAKKAQGFGLTVWVYTGFLWEEVQNKPDVQELLRYTDVLVDGRFVASERSLSLQFRGSRNQRIIDVPKSFAAGVVVEISEA